MREWEVMSVIFYISWFCRIESLVDSHSDMLAWVECGSSLTDDDLSREDILVWDQLELEHAKHCARRENDPGKRPGYEGVKRKDNIPVNFLTPNLLPAESRPFFELPPPRLVAVRTCRWNANWSVPS